MRTTFLTVTLAGAMSMLGAAGALGQEATPHGANLFAGLGLPELTITASEAGLAVDQSEVAAGRYLVTLVDETGNPDLATGFVRLDEGETLDDLTYADEVAAGTPAPEGEPPVETFVFLYDNYITGGPSAASPQVVTNLPAGQYGVGPDCPFLAIPFAAHAVTGDPKARITGPEPEAIATIIEEGAGGEGFTFRVDGALQAGPQIVKVLNASDQPHFIFVMQYPEPITEDQLMNTFMFDPSSGATPPPDILDESLVTFPGYVAAQSAGTTWLPARPSWSASSPTRRPTECRTRSRG